MSREGGEQRRIVRVNALHVGRELQLGVINGTRGRAAGTAIHLRFAAMSGRKMHLQERTEVVFKHTVTNRPTAINQLAEQRKATDT